MLERDIPKTPGKMLQSVRTSLERAHDNLRAATETARLIDEPLLSIVLEARGRACRALGYTDALLRIQGGDDA